MSYRIVTNPNVSAGNRQDAERPDNKGRHGH